MNQDTALTAYNPAAPADERREAAAALQQAHMPAASDLIPRADLAPVIDYIQDQYALRKAQVIEFPGRPRGKEGMQSVRLDRLQTMAYGDYFERPSMIGFDALRSMVEQTPVLNAVIMTRIRQVQRFCLPQEGDTGPGFQIAHVDPEHDITDDEQRSRKLLSRFLTNCGWEFNPRRRKAMRRDNFATFMAKCVRESLTYDAMAIETEMRNDGRGIEGLYALDGSTIRLCDDEGYRGDDRYFAVQVVTGQLVTAYTHNDLIYEPRNPRADVRLAGYGLGETELLVRVVTAFLNAMTHNAKGFDDNSIPRGILHLTGEYGENDLMAFKRQWNAMVRGVNNSWVLPVMVSRDAESKASFEKLGIDFDEMHFSKFMTFLVSIICAIYGMSPAEINFDSFTAGNTSALAGSDTAEKLAASKDSGLRPLMSYLESVLSDFVVGEFSEKYCFRWTGLEPEDQGQRNELRKAVLTVNELRAQEGYDPMDGPLGDAPLNPSLIGPWMQLTQQAQGGQDGGDGEDQGQEQGGQGEPDAGQDDDEQVRPQGRNQADAAENPQDEAAGGKGSKPGEWDRLAKANDVHDRLGRFASWSAKARETISGLVDRAKRREFSGRAEDLLPVSDQVIQAAKSAGLEVAGFSHAADVYGVHHALKEHGDDAVERARGQIPITDADLTAIPDIVESPDYMAFGVKSRIGRDLLVYLKTMPDGTTLYLEELRAGRHQLALQAMRKYPATIDAASLLRADNLNARSDGGDNFSVVDMRDFVKGDAFGKALGDVWAIEA